MVARFLRNLLIGQFIFMLAAAYYCYRETGSIWQALGVGVLAIILLRLVITLQNFVISWFFQSATPAQYKLSTWQKIVLFGGEFYATLISSSWLMWRYAFAQGALAENAKAQIPVLLIHGYGCNSGYWAPLSRQMSQRGINHYAVDLEPVMAEIDAYVPIIAQAVETICAATGAPQVIIIAHSMGGLVTRCYLRVHGHQRIAHVITLGSPHNGTGLANFGPGKNSRQMRFSRKTGSSAWLQALAASEDSATRALITSIYSHHDNIISPQTSSELDGAKNIAMHGVGHVALALNRRVQQLVLDEIESFQQSQQPADPGK